MNEVFSNFTCEYVCIFRFKDLAKLDDEFKLQALFQLFSALLYTSTNGDFK
ncbi:hypothetical protein [Caldicellulosiruptor bescii]|uniref:hypothetical protein n=1 Tax=Caldicellulosiruptor bescii TaxID=31899 RepID=UPI002093C939|nr:hypothetical protein [Caldicellulosiruptor bescii]